ncbi:Dynactin, 150 kDa isoform [Termitomyces sp. J132]|nr:Dynactin, 150 kDa isoform [Termitomyces sp. J132]
MDTADGPALGTIVTTAQGKGVVRYSGATSFSKGKWVGIELYETNGKNDGSVQGVSYFTCKMGHGIFVPPAARPTVGHQRTSSSGLLRASSIRTPPSSNASRSTSPAKPATPAKVAASTSSIAAPSSSLTTLRMSRRGSPTKRNSLSLQPRKSLTTSASSAEGIGSSPGPSPPPRLLSSSNSQPVRRTSSPLNAPPIKQSKSPSRPPSSLQTPIEHVQDDQEMQELRAKIRVLEAKRADDSRHVQELETRLSEAESFVALRPKLQAKLMSQQTELAAAKRELADAQQLAQLSETRLLDAQEQLEMAMLDKEVAEERSELAETELEELKEKFAVLEVETKVLREGGEEGDPDAGKTSLAYIQLEKQNERLKEALIKLRDMTQETEQDQRRRITEMEKDIIGLDDLQSQYESTLIKLSNAEVQIEDLKLQLDDALGAEEMLVQLTERNLVLGEKIEEMRITIEDLEALKELSDELEENHIETEKQLNEDLNQKDAQIHQHVQRVEALEDTCQDLENTITKFRDLVLQLQHELDDLRTQTQTAQTESATAASQTAAMMSLNLKLQSSALKNQAKNIDLEIRGLETRETKELLGIVQPYLPELYVESDTDATNCYMFFQRLAHKADLINNVVAQAHGLPDSLNGSVSETLVGVCEACMRARISGLSTLCKRFAAVLRRCDVESFLTIGRIFPEIAPMEKRIDMHINLLRKDEFREMECVSDIIKIQAQFDHLAETYFDGFDHDLGERELGYVLSFDHDLDMFAASIGLAKTSVESILKEEEVVLDMGGYDIETELFAPLQTLLDNSKSAKSVSKKLTKRMDDLTEDSSALKVHLVPEMKSLSDLAAELVNFGISLAQQIMPHLSAARSGKSSFQLTTLLPIVKQTASATVAKNIKPGESVWDAIGTSIATVVQEGSKLLPLALEDENVQKISGTAPWINRVAEIKASLAVNVEAERKVAQLNDEMQGLFRTLKTRDQSIQETSVKIELMERRLEAARRQTDTIANLENEITKAKRQERAYEEAMEQLQADLDALEQDNAKLKTLAAGQERQGIRQPEPEIIPIEGSLETSHLLEQIDALRGTVRFLRTENSYLKGQDLLREIESLPPLLGPLSRMPTPPLDPSGLSDSDDSDTEAPLPSLTLRSLTTETKQLYRDVIRFSSSPRVVDLSTLNSKRAEAKGGKVWLPKKQTPAHQVWERKMEAERLSRRVQGLRDRANLI